MPSIFQMLVLHAGHAFFKVFNEDLYQGPVGSAECLLALTVCVKHLCVVRL